MVEIIKGNIRLRSAGLDDTEMLNQWWNDGSVMEHAGFPKGIGQSLEETREIIRRSSPTSVRMILEIDGEAVGEASYTLKDHNAYPGWKICDPAYQNRGYGTKIILMIFDHLFSEEHLRIEKIVWDTLIENKRAQYVYENKLRARKTNVRENAFVDQLGRKRTSVEYGLSKAEFYAYNKERLDQLANESKETL